MREIHAAERPVTIDNHSLRVTPTPRQINLKTLRQIRLEMSRVYRQAKLKEIDIQDGTRLVYMLTQVAKMVESADLEKRVEVLEKQTNEYGQS